MNIVTKYEPYSGTIFGSGEEDRSINSIFVSIVCYRDQNILSTIQSLFMNSKRPHNIFASIAVAEIQPGSKEWVKNLISYCENNKNNIQLHFVTIDENITYGSLKKVSDSSYNKENYYMSVSSRSEFSPYWDDILMKQYEDTKNILENEVVLTCDPRGYLPHDEIVPGFVYFTNHKTKISMQREDYDGCRVPISGYTDFINKDNMNHDYSYATLSQDNIEFLIEKNKVKDSEEFLSNYKFINFISRKFVKNEYIAIATGVSHKFIFSEAKTYIRSNQTPKELVDETQFEFYSFVNLIKNNISIVSVRFTPVYQLYDEYYSSYSNESIIKDIYDYESYINSDGMEAIKKLIEKNIHNNHKFNELLGIDWINFKFKDKELILKNSRIDAVNSFISLYNFSTYENTLHWNKKC